MALQKKLTHLLQRLAVPFTVQGCENAAQHEVGTEVGIEQQRLLEPRLPHTRALCFPRLPRTGHRGGVHFLCSLSHGLRPSGERATARPPRCGRLCAPVSRGAKPACENSEQAGARSQPLTVENK